LCGLGHQRARWRTNGTELESVEPIVKRAAGGGERRHAGLFGAKQSSMTCSILSSTLRSSLLSGWWRRGRWQMCLHFLQNRRELDRGGETSRFDSIARSASHDPSTVRNASQLERPLSREASVPTGKRRVSPTTVVMVFFGLILHHRQDVRPGASLACSAWLHERKKCIKLALTGQ
jgi:hypothetical protein